MANNAEVFMKCGIKVDMVDGKLVVLPFETTSIRIPFGQWEAFLDHPLQRNTPKRWATGSKGHLAVIKDIHYEVDAAITPDMRATKLDGHARTLGMVLGVIPKRDMLVRFRYAADHEESNEFYQMFDSSYAVEGRVDKAYGALKNCLGGTPESSLLCKGIHGAIGVLSGGKPKHGRHFDIYSELLEYETGVELINHYRIPYNSEKISKGILAAMILTFQYHEHDAHAFWAAYLGKKTKTSVCGARTMMEFTESAHYQAAKLLNQNASDIFGVALYCYNMARTRMVKSFDTSKDIPVYDWRAFRASEGKDYGTEKKQTAVTKKQQATMTNR
jgi:hypothetical protein